MNIVTDKELRDRLRILCKQAGSQKALAKKRRISPSVLSDVINGRRELTRSILRLLKAKPLKHYEAPKMWFEDIE